MSDDVARQAQTWVSLLLSGEATTADARSLTAWRGADPCHEAAFARAARVHGLARTAAAELRTRRPDGRSASTRTGPSRRLIIGGAIAAASAGVVVLAGRGGRVGLIPPAADYETAKGETKALQLADGVSVELNTLTRIALRPDAGGAAFELLSGEAMVWARGSGRPPATVFAQGGETVLGQGRLALRCLDGEVRVSCLEGSAQVRAAGGAVALPPRHSLTYDQRRVMPAVPIDPEAEGAWRRGLLLFRNERLGDVIEEINRYREGRIVIASAGLRDRRVNGAFQTDQIDQIVDQLRLAYGVSATRLPGGVVVIA
ncbi:FecR family protein [Caulobacter mirabilis]|uniref:FecR family protein n=1 Tax=Caulobacter mirabilis TaxID=69666 RepID=UPI0015585A7A|nr:FecR domain-containing protein [Caulobacter mirabilis]